MRGSLHNTVSDKISETKETRPWMRAENEMLETRRHNDLPLARIKRIMKSDEDVRMISVREATRDDERSRLFPFDRPSF